MHKYLKLRGKTYVIRVPVPKKLQGVIGKPEITRSLSTRDFDQANKLYPEKLGAILKLFEIARGKLDNESPALLIGFNVFGVVNEWFHKQHATITATTKARFSDEAQLQEYKLGLKYDLTELFSKNTERRFHAVQSTANQLLLDMGYVSRKNKKIANVDFNDPKYEQLLELLITAQIELYEYELRRLGDGIACTPNGRVFWQEMTNFGSALKSRTPLSKLIDDYMSSKGSHTKAKTIGDKYAAFKYLTESVGEDFSVENLTRDHFVQIRKILEAFPKNATRQKVLKGMSLSEVSAYATAQNMEFMSKQNANKIIMRLKSLMEFAVSTAIIAHNPCKEIKFHISAAEKEASAREPYTYEQLQKLFTSEAFDKSYPKGPAMFWVPLLALLHGFRMEEILLLTLKEVKCDKTLGVWYFDLTGFTTDEVKNANAIRRVPFNPLLKNLGFHDYLSVCKNNKMGRLFPKLKRATGSDPTYRKLFSPKFSRYSKAVGVHTKRTVFHSFRRNFSIACSDVEIPNDYENALSGWTLVGGQGGTYKKPKDLSLEKLAEMMSRIEYPKLDLSHLYND
ncbi:MAG: DUF6538 domain-containing protein [Maricaulaceae bacterium]